MRTMRWPSRRPGNAARYGNRNLPGAGILLVLAVIAVFGRTVGHEFILHDDDRYVTRNPPVLDGLSPSSVSWALGTHHMGSWHPLTWISHMIDVELFGLWAGGHHLVNVLLHAGSAWLLFRVLLRMTGAGGPSLLVAALFALHPLRMESVAWVAERKDVLSTFFWMLTLAAYAGYVARPGLRRYAAMAASLALGLLSKPMLVTVPFTLLLLDIWPLRRWELRPGARGTWGVWREKAPLFALAAATALVTWTTQREEGAMQFGEFLPFSIRLQNALVSAVSYLGKTIFPTDLAIHYPHRAMTETWSVRPLPTDQVVLAASVLVAITALAVLAFRRRPYFLVGWLWYLITVAPVLGIFQVGGQAMADRYTYVPQIGILVAAVWGLRDLTRGLRAPRWIPVAAGVVLVAAAGVTTTVQLRHWRNTISVFEQAIRVTPVNPVSHYILAVALHEQGRDPEAVPHLEAAIRFAPSYADAQKALASALVSAGRTREAAVVWNDYGAFLARERHPQEAHAAFTEALRLAPDLVEAHMNLGTLLRATGHPKEAGEHFAEVLRLRPDYPGAQAALLSVSPGSGP